ncbi:hypothetical protein ABVT39_004477 [Epinephelus coioides]
MSRVQRQRVYCKVMHSNRSPTTETTVSQTFVYEFNLVLSRVMMLTEQLFTHTYSDVGAAWYDLCPLLLTQHVL